MTMPEQGAGSSVCEREAIVTYLRRFAECLRASGDEHCSGTLNVAAELIEEETHAPFRGLLCDHSSTGGRCDVCGAAK